ncbi:aminoglycoside phosphotransferase [Bacillus coahuilensis m2-6]|uniref:phosphotransferase enzyme family protein n=1 Tax=Bacillus coahuilensis TaxID=408580 RepID=UPI0007506929|nr:phosphotransferase [Bacillus coahuilensis]KUP09343.1 aminoglycoside phosphotransferase [Bacillus coahuilensis m2-6]
MELFIEKVFTSEVLFDTAKRFQVVPEEKPLGDFENFVFKARRNNGEIRILRFTHSSHRSIEEIEQEMSFLDYLGENGAPVAKPHRSINQEFVEPYQTENGVFYASLFDYAPGTRVTAEDPKFWNDELFKEWGKTIGQLHKLTKNYPHTPHRLDWEKDEEMYIHYLPNHTLKALAYEIVDSIKKLPKTNDTYGLIHSDVHLGNFHVQNGNITIFDFDDLMYQYFIHDLAIVLYYSLLGSNMEEEEKTLFARHQLSCLREGYESQHILDECWYEHLHLFLRLRDISLCGVIYKKFEGKDMLDNYALIIESIEERLRNRQPIVKL